MNPYVSTIPLPEDYRLEIVFENDEHRIFDVKPYLYRGVFVRLQNHSMFEAVRVVAGSVEWPGGLDLRLSISGYPLNLKLTTVSCANLCS